MQTKCKYSTKEVLEWTAIENRSEKKILMINEFKPNKNTQEVFS